MDKQAARQVFENDYLLEMVLNYVLSGQYQYLSHCMLVCRKWYKCVKHLATSTEKARTDVRLRPIKSRKRPKVLDFARGVRPFG